MKNSLDSVPVEKKTVKLPKKTFEYVYPELSSKKSLYITSKPKKDAILDVRTHKPDVLRGILRNVSGLIYCEFHGRRDKKRQPDSGLDLVIAADMLKYGCMYCVDVDAILGAITNRQYVIIPRLKQNLLICKKKGILVIYCSNVYSESQLLFFKHYFEQI
ncbi:MAG: hypothetical protein ACMXYK_04260 [Candidatus Woesearchaeota archaeon]